MKYELTHDTIAAQIADKASAEAKARRRVEAMLSSALDLHRRRNALLSAEQLDEIRPFESILRLSDDEANFIQKSKTALQTARRRRRLLTVGIIAALSAATIFSIFQARKANANAKRANAQRLAIMSKNAFDNKNFSDALAFAYESLDLQPDDNNLATQLLAEVYHKNYATYAPLRIATLHHDTAVVSGVFSTDNQHVATMTERGTFSLWRIFLPPSGGLRGETSGGNSEKNTEGGVLIKKITGCEREFKPVFSPDGSRVLVLKNETELTLLDTSGNAVAQLKGHSKYVREVAFSPSGDRIVTCGDDGAVLVFDKNGGFLSKIRGKVSASGVDTEGDVGRVKFSNDGSLLASVGKTGKRIVEIYDFKKQKTTATFMPSLGDDNEVPIVQDLIFSDSLNALLLVNKAFFEIRDKTTGALQRQTFTIPVGGLAAHSKNCLFSTDAQNVALITDDENVAVRKAVLDPEQGDGAILTDSNFTVSGSSYVRSFALSPVGERLAVCLGGELIDITDFSHQIIARVRHEAATGLAFSPDGNSLLTFGKNGEMRIWSARTEGGVSLPTAANEHVNISADGQRIFFNSNNLFQLHDAKGHQLPQPSAVSKVWQVACSPTDANRVLALGSVGEAAIQLMILDKNGGISTEIKANLTEIKASDLPNAKLSWSADGRFFLFQTPDTLLVGQADGQILPIRFDAKAQLTDAKLSPDGTAVLAIMDDSTATIWHLNDGRQTDLQPKEMLAVGTFSPDGKYLLTGSFMGKVRRRNTDGTGEQTVFTEGTAVIKDVFSTPDNSQTLFYTEGGILQCASSDGKIETLMDGVSTVWQSPNGQTLVVSTLQYFQVWHFEKNSGRYRMSFKTDLVYPISVAFTADGSRFVVRSSRVRRRCGKRPKPFFKP